MRLNLAYKADRNMAIPTVELIFSVYKIFKVKSGPRDNLRLDQINTTQRAHLMPDVPLLLFGSALS